MEIKKFKNFGVIPEIREKDFVAGTIPYEVVNPSGDWTPYVPLGENQYSTMVDSMACVSFSFLNVLETQLKFQGIDIDFSDRFLAKMSNTTSQGNTLGIVADTYRQYGCPLETDWPKPLNFTWDEFYADIPQEVKDKAIKYNISYEWVDTTVESLQYHLKQAPLQLVIPGHAICGIYEQADIFKYFDTYSPYLKDHPNPPQYAMKIVLNKMNTMVMLDGGKDIWLVKDGKRSLIYNVSAFQLLGGNIDQVQKLTQDQLNAIPDSGIVLAGIVQE